MKIFPAIDLIGGKAVRLKQGDYNQVSICDDDPVSVAKSFIADGAQLIHIVDLDGAKAGRIVNYEVIKKLVNNDIPIEVGGGIRTIETIKELLDLGVRRVILGSVAINNFDLLKEAIREFGAEKIVVGVDAKNGKVAVHGWIDVSNIAAIDLCLKLKKAGVKTIIYTDIAKDGMMQGPNIMETEELKMKSGIEVIASGGVSNEEDINNLNGRVDGVIVGKAIYAKTVILSELIKKYEVIK